MSLTNKTVQISGLNKTIVRGGYSRTFSDKDWETFITPIIYPLWHSDKDILIAFNYQDSPVETWKCEKKKYVRNHTTGEYFWKPYLFTEVETDVVQKFVADIDEAFDAQLSTEFSDIQHRMSKVIEQSKGLSLTRVKAWRDFFLRSSDWSMLEDAPVTADEKEQWKKYRKLCRELPDQFESGTQVLAEIKIPIDPIIYKKNYLPYNEGATYLGSDDQWVTFPGKDTPGGQMEEAMQRYVDLALNLTRPAPLFNVSNLSQITDPVEALIKQIETEQAMLEDLKAQQSE